MITTTQVRDIMRGAGRREIYTNKTRVSCGSERRVKCYMPNTHERDVTLELLRKLVEAAGEDNVTVTDGDLSYYGTPGITVRCTLA